MIEFKRLIQLDEAEEKTLWYANVTTLQKEDSPYAYMLPIDKDHFRIPDDAEKVMKFVSMKCGKTFNKEQFLQDHGINRQDILYSSVNDDKTTIVMKDGTSRIEDVSKYLSDRTRPFYVWKEESIGAFDSFENKAAAVMKKMMNNVHQALLDSNMGCQSYTNEKGHEEFIMTMGEKAIVNDVLNKKTTLDGSCPILRHYLNNNYPIAVEFY